MQHQETRQGSSHRMDVSPLPSSYHLSPQHHQTQQQQHPHGHHHLPQPLSQQTGTNYPPPPPLPSGTTLTSQHNGHSLAPHPSTLLQPQQHHTQQHHSQQQHPAMMSPAQLAQPSHLAYSSYQAATVQTTREASLKVYSCPEPGCNKQYTDMESYQLHARTDHGSSSNDSHLPSSSSENRPFACEHPGCGKAFKQYGNLKTHVRKHTGERPYQCPYDGCGKSFAQLGNLKTHEKIHWSVKPYICDFPDCNRGFTQRGNLKAHLIKVHHVNP